MEHWLWPLFAPEWQDWRARALQLPPVPLAGTLVGALAPPPPLMYALSSVVVPRPGYWPAAASLGGFWHDDEVRSPLMLPLPPKEHMAD